jgi:hypothetical protein
MSLSGRRRLRLLGHGGKISTTDFDEWLGENEPDTDEELYALHQSVEEISDEFVYSTTKSGDKFFVKGPVSTLVLATQKARAAFLREIDMLKRDDELDWDSWLSHRQALHNPKA